MLLAIDIAAKGLFVLAVAMVVARWRRRDSAAARYLVWSTAMLALLALPVLAAALPTWQTALVPAVPASWLPPAPVRPATLPAGPRRMAALPRPSPRAPMIGPHEAEGVVPVGDPAPRADGAATPAAPGGDAEPAASPSAPITPPSPAGRLLFFMTVVYLLGLTAVLFHLAAGVIGVARVVRGARAVVDNRLLREFEVAGAELGIERTVWLLESAAASVPFTWELRRPVVVLPLGAGAWPAGRRRVVFLHELAHVQRRDCQMQMLAHLALALHWLNPLAWLAVRRLRLERERACDDRVLGLGARASDYAAHLLHIARGRLPAVSPGWATVAMARTSHLEGRVAAILDSRNPRRFPQWRTNMIVRSSALVLLLPLAAMQPGVRPESAQALVVRQPGSEAAGAAGAATTEPRAEPSRPAAVPAGSPSIDELVQMRIHRVTLEFIEEVRAAFGRPVDVDELVQLRIHRTSPEFVGAIREALPNDELGAREIVQLRIHRVSEEFLEGIRELLPDEDMSAPDLTRMRIHGVTLDMVRELQEDGYDNLTVDDLVQMRIHGFDRWLRRRGGR